MIDGTRSEAMTSGGSSQQGGRPTEGFNGQFGVSDKRRAELAKMEQDAGQSHDAEPEDESTRNNRAGSNHETNPTSAEKVGNQTEPENTDRNQY